MFKPLLMVPALLLIGTPAFFQQQTPTPAAPAGQAAPAGTIPAEYIGKANPVKPTAELQERAKKLYGWDCAMCHGDTGNGKGDVAADQKLPMNDFKDSLAKMSDGEIFYIIQNGRGKMPSESDRANPDLIWNMVTYLRKMSNTTPTSGGAGQ
ncbi:MAG TPA: cytochrome c [Acidobacteriaceae bacterium]|nr:cytochrome c [Acidobacteriaceae bacterium]